MPQICIDSDEPYLFSHNGKPYIIPPRHGGKWEIREEYVPNKHGKKYLKPVCKKVGDSPRTYIDVPDDAWRMLNTSADHIGRAKGRIKLLSSVHSALEAEMEELRAAKKQLEEEQKEFAARLAVATASDSKTRKKTTRG